jgi:hypothetical protein
VPRAFLGKYPWVIDEFKHIAPEPIMKVVLANIVDEMIKPALARFKDETASVRLLDNVSLTSVENIATTHSAIAYFCAAASFICPLNCHLSLTSVENIATPYSLLHTV